VKAYRWTDLKEVLSLPICEDTVDRSERTMSQLNSKQEGDESLPPLDIAKAQIIKAMLSQDGLHVLVQIKEAVHGVNRKRLLIFDSQAFNNPTMSPSLPLFYHPLAQHVHRAVDIALGVLSNNQLAFLDGDLWLCTLSLDASRREDAIKRHYFIPRDWVTTESCELACMLGDGTLLCPKDADVAIVSYSWDN
jgi:hypothetical protein